MVLTFVKPRVNISAVKGYLLEHGDIFPVEIADRTDYARAGAKGLGLTDSPRVEVMPHGERRRSWSDEQKRGMVLESLGLDVTPTAVARRHGVSTG